MKVKITYVKWKSYFSTNNLTFLCLFSVFARSVYEKIALLTIISAFLSGCAPFKYSETPLATNFETTKQEKIQAAKHWSLMAQRAADKLVTSLKNGNGCIGPKNQCTLIGVKKPENKSEFSQLFHSELVSRMVTHGVAVASSDLEIADITLSIDIQTVKFSSNRNQYLGAGKLTMLATGFWALDEISSSNHLGASFSAAMIAADILEWNAAEFAKGPTPQLEMLVTVSAESNNRYLSRISDVYYLADSDAKLYCWTAGKCGAVDSDENRTRTFKVFGDCKLAACNSKRN